MQTLEETMMWFLLPAALAAEPVNTWEVGLGVRDSLAEENRLEGARLMARRRVGPLGVEAAAYGRLVAPSAPDMAYTVVDIAASHTEAPSFQYPVDSDLAALSVLTSWHPWPLSGTGAAPVFYAGLEGRQIVHLALDAAHTLREQGRGRYLGPVIGAGFELETGRLVSRLALTDRMHFARDAFTDDLAQHHAPTLSLDLMVRLGGTP